MNTNRLKFNASEQRFTAMPAIAMSPYYTGLDFPISSFSFVIIRGYEELRRQ